MTEPKLLEAKLCDDPEARSLHFYIPQHPPSDNGDDGLKGRHWISYHRIRGLWRELIATHCPKLETPLIWPLKSVYVYCYRSRGPWDDAYCPDFDNVARGSKPVWDALQDHGVLRNDKDIEDFQLRRVPVPSGKEGVIVNLFEL